MKIPENTRLRKAVPEDESKIWEILQQAILRRKKDGSRQWQDGYPNLETVKKDIEKQMGFVLEADEKVACYAVIILNDEPAYDEIVGKWLTNGDFFVIHRVAVSDEFLGKGFATEIFRKIEEYAKNNNILSVKVDTNFDNTAMLKILKNLNYQYCGKVYFRESERLAFEKVLA